MREILQNTATNVMVFMTDAADLSAGKTGLTLTITASKDGGAFASISPTVTERGNGYYNLALTSGHTDTIGDLVLLVSGTGAVTQPVPLRVIAINKADGSNAGLSDLSTLMTRLTSARAGYLDNLNGHTAQTGDTFAALPTNFGDLAITATTGKVTVGTNDDKSGYSISGTLTTLDALDTAQDSQHSTTQSAISGLNDPTAAAIADQVWDEVLSGHLTAGSTGASLNAAGSAGDPWTTSLPGSYTGTQAGKILADILDDVTGLNGDAMRGTDSAFLAVSAPTNFSSLGINVSGHLSRVTLVDTTTSNTDMRGTDSAYTGTPPTAAAITDAVLDEALSGHTTAGTLGKAVSDILADTNELQSDDVPGLIAALNDLDAAGVRTAVGLASANLDTQLGTIDSEVGVIDGIVDSILANQISGVALTSSERDSVAAAILDLSNGVEVGHTVKQALRLSSSALGGKVSGMDSNSPVFRNPGDTADRITATTDADGNRSAVVLNL